MFINNDHEDTSGGMLRAVQAAVVILLAIFAGFFLFCVFKRLTYPFELEWLEGELLFHIVRLLEGKSIYAAPATEFISEVYPPLYYYASALMCLVFDVGFVAPRVVSLASCLGIIILLYRIARHEGGGRFNAVVSAGFFISLYHVHGTWYDIGRIDMLFYCLIVLGCYVLAYGKQGVRRSLAGALFFVLACYTKQTALFFLPFVMLYLLVTDMRGAFMFAGFFTCMLFVIFMALNAPTDGWFAQYTLLNPLRYAGKIETLSSKLHYDFLTSLQGKLWYEMRYEIFYKLPVFFTLVAGYAVCRMISLKRPLGFSIWEYTAAGAAITYFMIRSHVGSEKNDFIPMTLWGCMLLSFLLSKLADLKRCAFVNRTRATVLLLLGLQLVLLVYNPVSQVPSADSARAGQRFIDRLKKMPGDVFVPFHAMYAVMADKKMIFNAGAFWGYQVAAPHEWVPEDLIRKIENKEFAAIIVDETSYYTFLGQRTPFHCVEALLNSDEYLARAIQKNYTLGERIAYGGTDVFRSLAGFRTRPDLILVAK